MSMKPSRRHGLLVLVIGVFLSSAVIGASASGLAQSEEASTIQLTAETPDEVGLNETFTATYELTNNGSAGASFTLEITDLPENISVEDISGDIQASDANSDPPSASTDFLDPNQTAQVTVEYQTGAALDDEFNLTAAAREPLSGATNSVTSALSVERSTLPSVETTDVPDTVEENSSFTVEYRAAADNVSLSVEATDLPSEINVSRFDGQIESQTPEATPPSASTSVIAPDTNATVSITYQVSSGVVPTEDPLNRTVAVGVTNPLTDATDTVTANISIEPFTPEPDDPVERATQIADGDDTSEIEQTDITIAITQFERGETVNGIDPTQSDISTLITLFARNN